jgi:hypothetical protein
MTEGVSEWLEVVEQALQGLNHALNNRIGSLAALVELNDMGDLEGDATSFETLRGDLRRLEECNRVIRLLRRDAGVGEEALMLSDVLADSLAIHHYLQDVRDMTVTIVPVRYVEPVRVERWALLRAMTLLVADATRLAKRVNGAVQAATESDEQWVSVEFRVRADGIDDLPIVEGGSYAATLAATFGGTVARRPAAVQLRLPTLKARRAADRR